ncbi:MAG TPA: hypothetical protein VIK33_19820 [Anaerolineae bacterium]
MSAMQLFYTRLFHAPEVSDPGLARLAGLTKISPNEVQALKTGMSWTEWPATTE